MLVGLWTMPKSWLMFLWHSRCHASTSTCKRCAGQNEHASAGVSGQTYLQQFFAHVVNHDLTQEFQCYLAEGAC